MYIFNDGTIESAYHLNYTTSEGNTMNYMQPIGPKLRYRYMPIVNTGTNIKIPYLYDNQWMCVHDSHIYGRYCKVYVN